MKIKIAFLDKDSNYLNRLSSSFGAKYSDKLEIFSFTDESICRSSLEPSKIDVLLASEQFEVNPDSLPKNCGFAYFVDSMDVESVNDCRAICKYQKSELIYKQILSVYAENASNVSGLKIGNDNCKVIAFSAASGGVGASTMAASCAVHFAKQGRKTLYLNLEKFGVSDTFFSGEGNFNMSDVIYALKSKKANLPLKLESCVRLDANGVYFYSGSALALDMLELTTDEIISLISELRLAGSYEFIILDLDFGTDAGTRKILHESNAIILVGDGSDASNSKTFRAFNALATMERALEHPLVDKTLLLYNKYSNKMSKTIEGIDLKNLGGAPRYDHATVAEIVTQLSGLAVFDKIFS